MRTLRIFYLISKTSPDLEREAFQMADFLRKNGLKPRLEGFSYEPGETFDALLSIALTVPIIDAPILTDRNSPSDYYIKGLDETKKNIDLIKRYVSN